MTKSIPVLSPLPKCHAQRHGYIWHVWEVGDVIVLQFWNSIVVGKWQWVSLETWRCVCCWVNCPGHFTFQNKILPSTSGSEVPEAHRTNCLQTAVHMCWLPRLTSKPSAGSRLRLKCDGTRAGPDFVFAAERTSTFKSTDGRQFSRLLAAEVYTSAVVMLDTACSEVVWRLLATHCIRHFPHYFLSRASPCTTTFQLASTLTFQMKVLYTLNCREHHHTSEHHQCENHRPGKDVKFVFVTHFWISLKYRTA